MKTTELFIVYFDDTFSIHRPESDLVFSTKQDAEEFVDRLVEESDMQRRFLFVSTLDEYIEKLINNT
jgi:hypothetical protein